MIKTPLLAKIFLVFLGVFLAFVILELGMRVGGFTLAFLQERGNRISEDTDEIRILCIGESTTAMGGADSYPSQLEVILNQKSKTKKFNVINKGVVSTNSDEILHALPGYIEKYKPHVVVSMIGINDYLIERNIFSFKGETFFKKLKVYQLLELLRLKILHKLQNKKGTEALTAQQETKDINALIEQEEKKQDVISDGSTGKEIDVLIQMYLYSERMTRNLINRRNAASNPLVKMQITSLIKKRDFKTSWVLVRIGYHFRVKGDYANAKKFLNMAIEKDQTNSGAFVELGRCYKEEKRFQEAIPHLERAYKIHPDSVLTLIEIGNCYAALGDDEGAYRIAQLILGKGSQGYEVKSEIGSWFRSKKYFDFAEEILLDAILKNEKSDLLYEQLADFYAEHGLKEKAQEYYQKALIVAAETEGYPMVTVYNYNKIAEILHAQGIVLIAMQYPRREIEPLQKIFWGDYRIIFVENKGNFEDALQYEHFRDFFSDRFGGDFGHCTLKGNRLIAKNLAVRILEDIINR